MLDLDASSASLEGHLPADRLHDLAGREVQDDFGAMQPHLGSVQRPDTASDGPARRTVRRADSLHDTADREKRDEFDATPSHLGTVQRPDTASDGPARASTAGE